MAFKVLTATKQYLVDTQAEIFKNLMHFYRFLVILKIDCKHILTLFTYGNDQIAFRNDFISWVILPHIGILDLVPLLLRRTTNSRQGIFQIMCDPLWIFGNPPSYIFSQIN